jgi:hypothetical protein
VHAWTLTVSFFVVLCGPPGKHVDVVNCLDELSVESSVSVTFLQYKVVADSADPVAVCIRVIAQAPMDEVLLDFCSLNLNSQSFGE